jgi:hypothetical protein
MTCTLTDVSVTGNVTVGQGAGLTVNGGTFSGNVTGISCFFVNLFGPDLEINGNVLIESYTGNSGASIQPGAPIVIDGNFQCSNLAPGGCTLIGATVGGNVLILNNHVVGFESNIGDNTISGNLVCQGNTPGVMNFSPGPNVVAGHKLGQCAAPGF